MTQGAHHGCQGTQDGFMIALVIGVVGIVKKFFKKSLRNLHDVEAFRDEVVGVLDIIGECAGGLLDKYTCFGNVELFAQRGDVCEQVVGSVLGRRKDDKYSFIVKKFRELFEGFLNVEDGIEQGFKEADGAFPDSLGDGAMGEGGAGVRGFQGIFGDENVGVVGEMSCAARDDVMFEEIIEVSNAEFTGLVAEDFWPWWKGNGRTWQGGCRIRGQGFRALDFNERGEGHRWHGRGRAGGDVFVGFVVVDDFDVEWEGLGGGFPCEILGVERVEIEFPWFIKRGT